MLHDHPKISVCVPTYNRAHYLRQALESVRCQTLQDFEIIIYDDASTDETQWVVENMRDGRTRYFRQPRNVGIAANRNSCLAVARGRYIAWLDSDDIYQPEMLAVQSAVLDRHPHVGLVHGAYEVIDCEGRRLADWPLPFTHSLVEPGKDAFRELVLSNYVTAPTVMVRRKCYNRAGHYATTLRNSSEDWDMWLRIALHFDLAYTATVVAQYRQHDGNLSTSAARSGQQLQRDMMVITRIFDRHHFLIRNPAALQRQAKAALATKALIRVSDTLTLGKRSAALAAAFQALRVMPALLRSRHGMLLPLSILHRNEYASYCHAKGLLNRLYPHLVGTRYGNRIQKLVLRDPSWQNTLRDIARTVRSVVPEQARVVIADKYDPTLLHLCRRKGGHFPNRHLLPDGYPRDSGTAISHLEQLQRLGANYLVFPCAAFWWLDHYREFQEHLDACHWRAWSDERCIIFRLSMPKLGGHL